MRFQTPHQDIEFTIPDDWWAFAEMESFKLGPGGSYYPYNPYLPNAAPDAMRIDEN